MRIEHLALWVADLEKMKNFYEKYFQGISGALYHNPEKNFKSYFLSFDKGCRLELMFNPNVPASLNDKGDQYRGLIHFAISVGNREAVDEITKKLQADGYKIVGTPRTTGDGYYESVILDPEDNTIEITE